MGHTPSLQHGNHRAESETPEVGALTTARECDLIHIQR